MLMAADQANSANLKRERVVIQTEHDLIEGTFCYARGLRLSDALNAAVNREKPYMSLVDATVTRLETGQVLFRSRFLLVSRTRIVVLLPKSEILRDGPPSAADLRVPAAEENGPVGWGEVKGPAENTETLVAALQEADPAVRRRAAEALGRVGPPADAVVIALVERLGDSDELVRGSAAEALGGMGLAAQPAVPALIEALQDREEFVRRLAAGALGNIGPAAREAVPGLTGALQDREEFVRRAAAEALGKIGPPASAARTALQQSLKDRDVLVRHWAAASLRLIPEGCA
jgi:hypothetical protein